MNHYNLVIITLPMSTVYVPSTLTSLIFYKTSFHILTKFCLKSTYVINSRLIALDIITMSSLFRNQLGETVPSSNREDQLT